MKKNTPSTTELEQEISSEYNIREKNVKKKNINPIIKTNS